MNSRTAFIVGWLIYATSYLTRKPLGLVKAELAYEADYSMTQLGMLDVFFLLPFSLGQIFLTSYADQQWGVRKTVSCGLLISGLVLIPFASNQDFTLFGCLLAVSGLTQSTLWPMVSKNIAAWFPESQRNRVFGLFATCSYAGGAAGLAIAAACQAQLGWQKIFTYGIMASCVVSLLSWIYFKEPHEVGVTSHDVVKVSLESPDGSNPTTFMDFLRKPLCVECALILLISKVVRYALLMWIPLLLVDEVLMSSVESGLVSACFDIGGILGSILVGFIVDNTRFGKQPMLLIAGGLFISAVFLPIFYAKAYILEHSIVNLLIIGACICAVDTLLSSSIPVALAVKEGGSTSGLIGFINGIATFGTVVEGPAVVYLVSSYGWYVFTLTSAGMLFCASLLSLHANMMYW